VATKVIMPKMGLRMIKGKIVKWLKNEGDRVAKGEALLIVESDKITNEVVAPAAGVLRKVFFAKDGVAPVSVTLAVIGEADEEIDFPAFAPTATAITATLAAPGTVEPGLQVSAAAAAPAASTLSAVPAGAPLGPEAPMVAPLAPPSNGGRLKISPLALKMAEEYGLDVSAIAGSGPEGRIVKEDIEEAIARRRAGPAAASAPGAAWAPPPAALSRAGGVAAFEGMRRFIAERMVESRDTAVHVTVGMEVDATELVAMRERLKEESARTGEPVITYTDIIVKAVARALLHNPQMLTYIDGEQLVTPGNIDIAIGVSLGDRGLVVPVIRNCEALSLAQIAAERRRLTELAQADKLGYDDVTGAVFTITNLGGKYPVQFGTPIINQPQSAILGTGTITERVIAKNGQVAIAPMMNLFMSVDHRVLDGEPAARFLDLVRQILENPGLGFTKY